MICMVPEDDKTVLRKYSYELAYMHGSNVEDEVTCNDDASSDCTDACIDDCTDIFLCIDFPDKLSDLAIGNYLVAPYGGLYYVGVFQGIVERESSKIKLKFLTPPIPNSTFQWPTSTDRGEYPIEDIV